MPRSVDVFPFGSFNATEFGGSLQSFLHVQKFNFFFFLAFWHAGCWFLKGACVHMLEGASTQTSLFSFISNGYITSSVYVLRIGVCSVPPRPSADTLVIIFFFLLLCLLWHSQVRNAAL